MSDESAQVSEDIILVCDSVVLKFRAGTSSKANLARAKDKWGPGTITDNEGYEVTDESPVLATGQYEYQRSSASIMTMFKDKSELEHYLRGINPNYDQYAEILWRNQVTSVSQLGDASVSTLLACGIESALHAENIIARSKAVVDPAIELRLSQLEQQAVKRHKTGFTETPLPLADEGVMWEQEVVLGKTACQTCHIDELLQPKQPLLAALRYLFLLHQGQSQDAEPVVVMKKSRTKGQADLETVYYPHMLQIFQAAAIGQDEVAFLLEDHATADTARPNLRCFIKGVESHPGEAKARNVSSNPLIDPVGIHSNKDAFGKLHKVMRSKFLRPGRDQVFFCPFIVRIECCWIAKFDYQWVAGLGTHRLMSCSVCPPIPGKDVQPEGVLCQDLDDMLKHISASEAASLTDLLLMAGSASPTPGFHMLVQYVATLCHLQSVPVVQPQLRLHDQQTLDISQVHILAHGHKSLVVQLGRENAVYKIAHSKLIGNELMIHRRVDATVPFIIKSDLDAYGTVEGAGPNLSFLKLQLGSRLSTCPQSMLPHYWQCTFQAVTGLHAAGVLHRDIKAENMLLINNNVVLNDFDVSCLISSSEATLCSRVGTDDFRSPLWQAGEPYGTLDDLASLLLSFAWLLHMRTEPLALRIKYLSEFPAAPHTMINTAMRVLSALEVA